jgi:hypothetical protein
MAKRKSINITVPKPCHEKWSKMTPDGSGRYCSSCNKTVVDFSNFTDKELVEYILKHPRGCGSFDNRQLNRTLIIPTENNNSFFSKALLGTALFAGIASHSEAQANKESLPFIQVPVPTISSETANKNSIQDTSHVVKGTVVNSKTKRPLGYVSLTMKAANYTTTTETDSAGNFTFYIPENLRKETVTIETNDSWYHKRKETVKAGKHPTDMVLALKQKHHWRTRTVGAYF